jgi:hypothetical protein
VPVKDSQLSGSMMSIFGKTWRITAGLSAYLCVCSCISPLPDDVPPLDESRAKDIVAVIDVVSVRFYERNGGFGYSMVDADGEESVIYASAPPFRVSARVVTQLYGPRLSRSIHFKTHSHWGKDRLTNGNLKLVHLETDGITLMEPDENDTDVGVDSRGRLIVPVYPSPIHLLPCGVEVHRQLVTVTTPASGFAETLPMEPAIPTPPDLQKKIDDEERVYYRIKGELRYPRYGIPVDDIAKFLKETRPAYGEFWCQRE